MKLAVFLTPGDSLQKQAQTGQDKRFINYYLKPYSQAFEKVYLVSYGDNKFKAKLPKNVYLLQNKKNINYFCYQFLIPIFYRQELATCQVLRVMQATGGLPAVIAKLFFQSRILLTYGFDYSEFAGFWLKAFLLKIYLSLILTFCDKIIVTSSVIEQKLKKRYREKLVLIPNGVDTDKFKKIKTKKANKKIILNIARLEKQKNQQLLVKAVAGLKLKDSLKVLLIGQGKLKFCLQALAEKEKVNLQILETIAHEQLPKYYSQADIFCLPSLYEGQSKVLLEALSCQMPVCASSIPANREIIDDGKNGLLFDLTAADLSKALEKLLDNENFKNKLSLKGRERIIENHNIKKLVEKEISLLQKWKE